MAADFGFDDDEFDLDTGIDIEEEGLSDSLETSGELEFNNNEDSLPVKNPKKVAIIAIIMGLALITICLGLFSLSQHTRDKDTTNQTNVNTVKTTENDIEGNKGNNTNQVSVDNTYVNDWVQFELANDMDFNNVIDGEFTVTSIQHFAKVVNSQNDKIVKSILKGNISGLVGTYEVEIPYYKAVKLQLGTLLKIQYRYNVQNGAKVIGEISFI